MLRFDTIGVHDQSFLIEGLETGIRDHLSKISGLRVISRRSVEGYDPNHKSIKRIGADFNAKLLLMGEVQIMNNSIKVNCEIINSLNEAEIWANTFIGPIDSIIKIKYSLIKEISDVLQPDNSDNRNTLRQEMNVRSLDAYLFYVKGLERQQRYEKTLADEDINSAIEHYLRALEIDPLFAKAIVGIAKASWDRDFDSHFYEKSVLDSIISLCNRALSLDPYLDEAYYIRSRCYLAESRFVEHKNDLLRALELNPNFAEALRLIGEYYFRVEGDYNVSFEYLRKALDRSHGFELAEIMNQFCWFYLELGMFNRAIEFGQEEKRIRRWSTSLFWTYMHQGSFENAYNEAIEYERNFPGEIQGFWHLAISSLYLEKYEESKGYFIRLLALFSQSGPDHRLNRYRHRYGYLLRQEGLIKDSQFHFDESVKFLQEGDNLNRSRARDNNAYNLAAIAAFLGDHDKAYEWLGKLTDFGWHWGYPFHIRRDPMFRSMLEEKKFNDIVEEALNDKAQKRMKLMTKSI